MTSVTFIPDTANRKSTPLSFRMVIAAAENLQRDFVALEPDHLDERLLAVGHRDDGNIARGRRSASAYAREITHLLRLPIDKLSTLLGERPALALIVYRNACGYFAAHLGQMALERDRPYF